MRTRNRNATERAVCPECLRKVVLNPVWGGFSVHGKNGLLCPGSGALPDLCDRPQERQLPLFS